MYHYSFNVAFDKGLEESEKKLQNDKELITDKFRGWNYAEKDSPVRPRDLMELSVGSVVYHNKSYDGIDGLKKIKGRFIHKVYAILFQEAVKFINMAGKISDITAIQNHLSSIRDNVLDIEKIFEGDPYLESDTKSDAKKFGIKIYPEQADSKDKYTVEFQAIISDMKKIWDYESLMLSSKVLFHISNSHKMDDSNLYMAKADLIQYSIPFLVEHKMDGTRIGLSGGSILDIFTHHPKKAIIDIKTGPEDFVTDSLEIAGYALIYESQSTDVSDNINFGCLMYVRLNNKIGIPLIKCRTFVIDNGLRNSFLLKRDQLMKEKFENEQIAKGLIKYKDDNWGTPEQIELWEFEDEQIAKGLKKYKDGRWGTPEQIKTWEEEEKKTSGSG